MTDIYATPGADLSQDIRNDRVGVDIDDAIAGNFEVKMLETLGEAWNQLKGFKFKCLISIVMAFLVTIAFVFLLAFGLAGLEMAGIQINEVGEQIVFQIVFTLLTMPMGMAFTIMGIRHAQNKQVSSGEVFRHFGSMWSLLLTYIIMYLMIIIGTFLLILPGIYLMYAYMFAMPLVVEKKMGAWQALETSRRAVTKVWFRFFGFIWLLTLINMIAMIPLGLGWIWTIPWSVLAFAMVYIKMFGAEAHTLAD